MPNAPSPPPIIKVCGLTRFADLGLALRLGAHYAGVVVDVAVSPRSLPADLARHLLRAAQGRGVLLTTRQEPDPIIRQVGACALAAVQLHGKQRPEVVRALADHFAGGPEVWAVVPVPADAGEARELLPALNAWCAEYAHSGAAKVVLDAQVGSTYGGTGTRMSWHLAAELVAECPVPVLIAGGITPENALEALQTTGAAGVDVSSGVELRPGVKSAPRMRALLEAVKGQSALR